MTIDLDRRGSDAAAALDRIVARALDEGATVEMFEVATGLRSRAVVVDRATGERRSRRMPLLAVAATVLLLGALAIVLHQRDRSPLQPLPGPEPTALTTTTTTPTSLVVDEVSTHLPTLGDPVDGTTGAFLPYPPNVVSLPDGRVLKLTTGFCSPGRFEIFDPITGVVTDGGAASVDRSNPAMVQLADGRVLIAGGDMGAPGADNSCSFADQSTGEVFDPSNGTSLSTGPLLAPRWRALGALLPDGRVLLVGTLATPSVVEAATGAEIYDPDTNRFTAAGDRTNPGPVSALHTLADGRIVVVSEQPEIYDPVSGTFTAFADHMPQSPSASVLLPDGTVLAILGQCVEAYSLDGQDFTESHDPVGTRVLDPVTGTVREGPDLPHCVETATLLPNGNVLLTGYWWYAKPAPSGVFHAWAGLLDPSSGDTQPIAMPNRRSPVAVPMGGGDVLLVGGVPLDNAETLVWADVFVWSG